MSKTEQDEQLDRVSARIGHLVRAFVLAQTGIWTSSELRAYVAERTSTAPASADRVLRDLRQRGIIDYRVVSRAESTYVTVRAKRAA